MPFGRLGEILIHYTGAVAMTDNKDKRGTQDRTKVNVSEVYEVRYWSEKFGVTTEQLKEAVKSAGNSPDAVEQALKKSKK